MPDVNLEVMNAMQTLCTLILYVHVLNPDLSVLCHCR